MTPSFHVLQQRVTLSGVIFMLLAATIAGQGARAQSLERAYIAARGAAATKLESMKGDAFDKAQVEAQRSLEPKLRSIVGPLVAPPGFSGRGEFHPTALCCELGAGALDGLSFADGKDGTVVVTTEGLLRLWHRKDPKTALANDSFRYTDGLGVDAAVSPVAALPIRPPAGASLAVARLLTQCNGECSLPDFVTVVVIKRGRAWLAMVKAAVPEGAPPTACDAVWQEASDKYRKAYATFDAQRSTPQAYALLMAANKLETEGGAAVQKCVKEKGASAFPGLTRQAQALADGLAAP
jgi:hypothetical protein